MLNLCWCIAVVCMMDKKKHSFEVAYLYIEAIFRCPLFILSCVAMLMRVTYSSLRIDAVSFYGLDYKTKVLWMGRAGGWNPVLRELQSARVFWPTKLNLVFLRGYGKSQYLVCELRDPLTQRVCTLQPWMSHPVCAGWWMQGRWAHCRFWSSWQCPACLDGWRLGQIEGIKFLDILCRTQFKLNFKNILFK